MTLSIAGMAVIVTWILIRLTLLAASGGVGARSLSPAEAAMKLSNLLHQLSPTEVAVGPPKAATRPGMPHGATIEARRALRRAMSDLADGSTCPRGLTTSGGLGGDGDDWLDFAISPRLARDTGAAIRTARDAGVLEANGFDAGIGPPPNWWPKAFPPDASGGRSESSTVVVSPSAGHAWVHRARP